MQTFIISFMNQFGYFGILFLIALENIFPPIPSEVILTFGGFMTTYTNLHIVLVILFATIGSVLGALALYGIGRILNKERLEKILSSKWGRILHIKKDDIEKADAWFDKSGSYTVFFCRFIPIVRSLISIPAGMSEMPLLKFSILTTIGTLIWNTVLVIAGSILGENWDRALEVMNRYSHWILVLLIILCILGALFFYRKKKNRRS